MDQVYRILIVHNKYRFAGGEDSVVMNEKQLLESHGHSVSLYIKENTDIANLSFLKKLFLPLHSLYSFQTYLEIKKIIQEKNIDIVHVHNTLPLISFSVYYAARHLNCALVQTIHNFRLLCPNGLFYRNGKICEDCLESLTCSIKYKCYRNSKLQTMLVAFNLWMHRRLGTFHKPDAYIVLTDFNKKKLSFLISEKKLFVKPNFTDMPPIFSTPKKRTYFIYISRLEENKGIYLLLQTFENFPDEKLLIIGTGPEEKSIQKYIYDKKMKNVELLGFLPHDKIMPLLYDAKALLFPTQWYEGFPVIIAESFSAGTPIIGSNIGNVASIIEHGRTGLLFQHDNVIDCIAKIKEFISDSFNHQALERNCYETFYKFYSPAENYRMLFSIYKSIT